MLNKDIIQLEVLIGLEKAQKNLDKTTAQIKAVTNELRHLENQGKKNTLEYDTAAGKLHLLTEQRAKDASALQKNISAYQESYKKEQLELLKTTAVTEDLEKVRAKLVSQSKKLQVDSDMYKQHASAIVELNTELKRRKSVELEVQAAMQRQGTIWHAMERIGKASLGELHQASRALKIEIEQLEPGTKEFIAATKNLTIVEKRINDVEKSFKGLNTEANGLNLGHLAKGALPVLGAVEVASMAKEGLTAIVTLNARISDAMSDVEKSTGMSKKEIGGLVDELKDIDTRTSVEDLLKIATVGGQIGISGTENVFKFTKAIDKLNVALGDEFTGGAEEVTNILGGLSLVLSDVKTGDTATDILNLGNALNSLGAAGSATAPVVSDFANRIGGAGIPLGLTSGQVLGLSATLQELQVNAERGGTAVVAVLTGIASNTDNYSKVLGINSAYLQENGIAAESFKDLVKTDLNGALQLAIKRISELSSSNVDMTRILKDLEIGGSGELEVLLKLTENQTLLTEKTNLATKSLKDQNSINAEFETKNNNLAASLDKLGNRIKNAFIDSDLAEVLKVIVDGTIGLVDGFEQVYDATVPLLSEALKPMIEVLSGLWSALGVNIDAVDVWSGLLGGGANVLIVLARTVGGLFSLLQLLGAEFKTAAVTVRDFARENELMQSILHLIHDTIGGITSRFLRFSGAITDLLGRMFGLKEASPGTVAAFEEIGEVCDGTTNNFSKQSKELDKAGAKLKDYASVLDKSSESQKNKKETTALLTGSLAYLKEEVAKLNKDLENAPPEYQKAAAERLAAATQKLAEAEERLAAIKNPQSRVGNVDAIPSRLVGQIDVSPIAEGTEGINDLYAAETRDILAAKKEQLAAIGAAEDEAAAMRLQKQQENEQAAYDFAINAATTLSSALFDISAQNSERQKNAEIAALERLYAGRIERAKGNQKEEEKLARELDRKKEAIEREAHERQKRQSIAQAIVNGALAITKILAESPKFDGLISTTLQIAAAGIITAAQVGTIASQKFDKGGVFVGASHRQGGIAAIDTATGQKVAEFEGGEAYMVLSKRTTENNGDIISALLESSINQGGKKIFETGGVFGGTATPPRVAFLQTQQGLVGGSQIETLLLVLLSKIDALTTEVSRQHNELRAYITYDDIAQSINDVKDAERRATP